MAKQKRRSAKEARPNERLTPARPRPPACPTGAKRGRQRAGPREEKKNDVPISNKRVGQTRRGASEHEEGGGGVKRRRLTSRLRCSMHGMSPTQAGSPIQQPIRRHIYSQPACLPAGNENRASRKDG